MPKNNPVSSQTAAYTGPRYSGFDKSFRTTGNLLPGKIYPILFDPLIAGARPNLKSALRAVMPPLATDTFMNCKIKLEAFFCPASACYGGFNDFITKRAVWNGYTYNPEFTTERHAAMPSLAGSKAQNLGLTTIGSLGDWLGFKGFGLTANDYSPDINFLPFVAYWRIWDRYYRNSLVQKPIFSKPVINPTSGSLSNSGISVCNLPWLVFQENGPYPQPRIENTQFFQIGSYSNIFSLATRNFDADYFTTATPTPQRGDPATIALHVDVVTNEGTGTGDGVATIASVRAANALQLFRERNNLVGDGDIRAYNRVHYGVNRSGAAESLPVFLGSGEVNIINSGVTQTSPTQASPDKATKNPYSSIAAVYGRGEGDSTLDLVENFEAPEYGYFFVMATVVPSAHYGSGISRHLLDIVNGGDVTDIPDALLQQAGPQELYQIELAPNLFTAGSSSSPNAWKAVFGYQQRYAHYMDKTNEIHGQMRHGGSLEAFVLQRNFDVASIGTNFLAIPQSVLDDVIAVNDSVSQLGVILDCYHDYRVSMPLAAYVVPSLENPDGETEFISKPGYRF